MTDNSFDNLRTLHAATTPGEWTSSVSGNWMVSGADDLARFLDPADLALTVAAKNELPALLARLNEVTAERDALAAVIEEIGSLPHGEFGPWDDDLMDAAVIHKILSTVPSSVLADHDAKVRAEALRGAADLIENYWAPDSADGEEIVIGSVDLLRARADEEENR